MPYIHIYIYIYIHTYTHIHTHMRVNMYKYTYTQHIVCMYTYLCVGIYIDVSLNLTAFTHDLRALGKT